MKNLTVCVITTLLTLAVMPVAFAAKGGKGGKPPSNVAAEFLFPLDAANNVLTGDNESGVSSYKDSDLPSDAGISAFFMGSGNPKLQVDEHAERTLILRLNGSGPSGGVDPVTGAPIQCPFGSAEVPLAIPVRGDALWFADLNSLPDGTGTTVGDNNFLSMAGDGTDGTYYSMMPVRFLWTEGGTEYLYSVLFGSQPENPDGIRTRVSITRLANTWTVTGINPNTDLESTARIKRTDLSQKGKKRVTEYVGHCDIKVDFDIELLP